MWAEAGEHRDQEPLGVRRRTAGGGHDPLQVRQGGLGVDAVGHLAGDRSQLRAEGRHDDRGWRVGPEEAPHPTHRPGPGRADRGDVVDQGGPALGVVAGPAAQGELLAGVGTRRAGARPEAQQEPTSRHLLQGGGHLGHHPGVPVGLVQDQRAEHDPLGDRSKRGEQRPALEHVALAVHDSGQVVPGPDPVPASRLSGDGQVTELGPRGVEGVDQEIEVHRWPA